MGECETCHGGGELLLQGRAWKTVPCPECKKEEYKKVIRGMVKEELAEVGRLLDYDYERLEITQALRARLGEFLCSKDGTGLTLFGDVGRGKTTVVVATAVEYCMQHSTFSVRYVLLPQLFRQLRAAFDRVKGVESEFGQMAALEEVKVLILDDLGTEKPTPYSAEALFEIMDERMRMRRPTLVTMNCNFAMLEEHLGSYGKRIVSRLIQMNGKAIELTGDDRRLRR